MELDKLEQSVQRLSEVVNDFPIGAVSLDDFKPVEEKIQEARKSLMHLNARLLMLKAKYKQHTENPKKLNDEETQDTLQSVISETLLNAKAIKLCLHSTTVLSILNKKEGDEEDQKKLYTYMSKLFTLNDNIMAIQETIEKASQIQLDLKLECQKALIDYKDFLKEQEQIKSKRLEETYPEIVQNKHKMERTLRKINIIKKLIRNFIAASSCMLLAEPIFVQMLKNHRESININKLLINY